MKPLIEVRCPGCTRYLMKWQPNAQTWVVIKCRRCKTTVELRDGMVVLFTAKVDTVALVG